MFQVVQEFIDFSLDINDAFCGLIIPVSGIRLRSASSFSAVMCRRRMRLLLNHLLANCNCANSVLMNSNVLITEEGL